jgi:hypothetical protein
MSVFDQNGLGDWLADRLVQIGEGVKDDRDVYFGNKPDTFLDDRLKPANLPKEPVKGQRQQPPFRRQQGSLDFPVQ